VDRSVSDVGAVPPSSKHGDACTRGRRQHSWPRDEEHGTELWLVLCWPSATAITTPSRRSPGSRRSSRARARSTVSRCRTATKPTGASGPFEPRRPPRWYRRPHRLSLTPDRLGKDARDRCEWGPRRTRPRTPPVSNPTPRTKRLQARVSRGEDCGLTSGELRVLSFLPMHLSLEEIADPLQGDARQVGRRWDSV